MTRTGIVYRALIVLWGSGLVATVGLAQGTGDNVLFLVADDLGVDILECYGEGGEFPPTPNINLLRDAGVLFRHASSNPVCSTTRATIQTGRYGFRTGIGAIVDELHEEGLRYSETIIPEMLDLNPSLGYTHAAIGKWHLTSDPQGGPDGPTLSGYSHYSGTLHNVDDYYAWPKTENGVTFNTDVYITTDNANEAIEWINDQGETPWFMWLAFTAPHKPWQRPPDELFTIELSEEPTNWEYYKAMVEAMDAEMGRLFASIPADVLERTNIIFLGDNGTPKNVTQPPFDPDHAKTTLFEGGINVPLIISGPQVVSPGRESVVLVNTTDLFATALELMGVDVQATIPAGTTLDSVSVVPTLQDESSDSRLFSYSEMFNLHIESNASHGKTARNHHFKLIRFTTHPEKFFDLVQDPFETSNLLNQDLAPLAQQNYDELSLVIDAHTACEGDVVLDGTVDPLDSGFVLARYGCNVLWGDLDCVAADVNGDQAVDPLDSGFVLARFGDCL
ncbi:MAG: sulfatase-like hydrolase/transferase [Planctomycetes bacterium]|nr:sulfatase-like hydrolase/transferase [Planctomycetota bacterium]